MYNRFYCLTGNFVITISDVSLYCVSKMDDKFVNKDSAIKDGR